MVETIGIGNDAKTDGSWEQGAKVFLALEAVADAARVVEEEAATITWRHSHSRDGTITNETGREAWRAMVAALDALKKARGGD